MVTQIKPEIPQDEARRLVYEYAKKKLDQSDDLSDFELKNVYLVWFNFTLGNWKALCSTTLFDGMYYEVTHSHTSGHTYLDAYKKWDNVVYEPPLQEPV